MLGATGNKVIIAYSRGCVKADDGHGDNPVYPVLRAGEHMATAGVNAKRETATDHPMSEVAATLGGLLRSVTAMSLYAPVGACDERLFLSGIGGIEIADGAMLPAATYV